MKFNRNSGFSLLEIFISATLIGGLLIAASQGLIPWLIAKKDIDNIQKMEKVRTVFNKIYEENSFLIEDRNINDSTRFTVASRTGAGGTATATVTLTLPGFTTVGGRSTCNDNSAFFAQLSGYLDDDTFNFGLDGYKNSICIFKSLSVIAEEGGTEFIYTTYNIVSPGKDTIIQSLPTTPGDPFIEQVGDDIVVTISGLNIQRNIIAKLKTQLDRAGDAYLTYFTSRFLANPGRDFARSYFCRDYDFSVAAPVTCSNGSGGNVLNLPTAATHLGAIFNSPADFSSDYSRTLSSLNLDMRVLSGTGSSSYTSSKFGTVTLAAKNPATSPTPPYSAIVAYPLPGGRAAVKTLIGNY